jgi:hypothetical protein
VIGSFSDIIGILFVRRGADGAAVAVAASAWPVVVLVADDDNDGDEPLDVALPVLSLLLSVVDGG